MLHQIPRYFLRCSHDGDNDFLWTDDIEGTWMRTEDVEKYLLDLQTEKAPEL